MESFLLSTSVVALAEIGDKTQLLAFVLAARFRKPVPIILGIFLATILNHAFAGAVGAWITTVVSDDVLRWILGLSFLAMAAWVMIPDKLDENDTRFMPYGAFLSTLIAFFFAEMGDKTQIATVALAAQYPDVVSVIAGTTLGMMVANVPAVYMGNFLSDRISMRVVHGVAAAIFAVLGAGVLLGFGF
ncbi:TMEM165/GDT1 family protein [Proteobacteria bacterium 005FR1]|nr:TMEM165/GDT1 family protein [Proteobacteria bacterium 005FR1]